MRLALGKTVGDSIPSRLCDVPLRITLTLAVILFGGFAARADALNPLNEAGQAAPATVAPDLTPHARPLRYAFFANWDQQSLTVLDDHLDAIDILVPVWLHLASRQGDIALNEPEIQKQVVTGVRSREHPPRIMPLVNNYIDGAWNADAAVAAMRDGAARANLVHNLASYVKGSAFAGINVDFEGLPADAETDLENFVSDLHTALGAENAKVTVTLPLFDSFWSPSHFASISDGVILMSYDEHSASTEPGPIASQDWFENGVETSFAGVDPAKLVVAVGNYGYDWQEGGSDAGLLTFDDAVQTARMHNTVPTLDPESGNHTYRYTSVDGKQHEVWYLDGVSAFNEIRVTLPRGPQGYALWRIGAEDPSVWEIFRRLADPSDLTADAVRKIVLGSRVGYHGSGEILRIDGRPNVGLRDVKTDPATGTIISDFFEEIPTGYEVARLGHQKGKVVALTFDDGPDPVGTPKILDILGREGIHATFFVVGTQIEQYPALLSEIARRGHAIGNHTWSHPYLSTATEDDVRSQLQRARELITRLTGRAVTLFRPPYAEGLEARSEKDLEPLRIADDLGLDTVGMDIDPQDWAGPGEEEIVRRVVEGAREGEGNIVALHDSGDNSSQTSAALPQMIKALRDAGFSFVTVPELLEGAPRPTTTTDK